MQMRSLNEKTTTLVNLIIPFFFRHTKIYQNG